jgi:hypothetical protein
MEKKVSQKTLKYNKQYQEKKANEYPGYSVYYLPEEHYVGMSRNVWARINKHKHLGRITENYEILGSFENPIEAHLLETRLHLMGYNGYRA